MGLFEKFFKSGKSNDEKQDFSYVSEIAALITNSDANVMKNINFCVDNPAEYAKYNMARYEERGIDINKCDADKLCWLALLDELEANGDYLLSVDWNCELGEFLWTLEQIKTYNLIDIDLSSLNLNENEDVPSWGEQINAALGGRAYICMIDIDSDSYELIIVTADIYEKISHIAESNGHKIQNF